MPTQPFFWASQANAPIDSLPSFDDAAEANKKTLRPAANRTPAPMLAYQLGDEAGAVVEGCRNCRPHSPLCRLCQCFYDAHAC